MGVDIHVRVIKRDPTTNLWEEIKLYKLTSENKYEYVDLYPYRNSELFDILQHTDFPGLVCHPEYLPEPLKQEIEDIQNDKEFSGYYGFSDANLADIKLYLMKHPKVRDYDYESKDAEDFEVNGWKNNPVKFFVELKEL